MIGVLVTSIRLCSALLATHGAEVPHDRLCRAAIVIAHVADEWPPELIAAIAYRESRFDPRVVNARTGTWGALQVRQQGPYVTIIIQPGGPASSGPPTPEPDVQPQA